MNDLKLMGRVITDPNMTYSPGGLAITKFRMETPGWGERAADTHSITVFGSKGKDGLAGYCAQHVTRGSKVLIQARHSEKEYDGKDGKKYYNSNIVAFSVNLLAEQADD